jgi:stage II sporulation protein D
MKQVIYMTLLLIAIPFFIVIITINEEKKDESIKEQENDKLFVRVKRETTGTVENVELENYIVGVIAGEMPINFHIEALKAQAVAARSYVLRRMEKSNTDYDVVDSVTNQVYLDDDYLRNRWQEKYNENISKLKRAVLETSLEYIDYDGKIADALFFSTSNGFTENSEEIFSFEVPYLRSVSSIWDELTSPVFNDQKTFAKNEFFSLLGIKQTDQISTEVMQKSSTGRVLKIKINGVEMQGSDVATKLKLRSNDFEIIDEGEIVRIKTNGYGHGVGMSQYGALGMANEGYKYDEILKHYYNGVTIKKITTEIMKTF